MNLLKWKLIVLVLFSVIFLSCTDENDDEFTDLPSKFPLLTGNTWEYEKTLNIYSKDNSTAVGISTTYTDTSIYNYMKFTEVKTDTLLEDTIPAYIVENVEIELNIKQDDDYSIDYLWNKEDGLYEYVDRYVLNKITVNDSKKYRFKEIEFDTLNELKAIVNSYGNKVTKYSSYETSKVIEYPIEEGNEWYPLDYWLIGIKKVIDYQNISVTAGDFEVYEIRTYWDWDEDGIWDDDMVKIEYLSKYGIVKTRYEVWNSERTDEHGDLLGYYDWIEDEVLVDYEIIEE
ncbi:MAG: hypothetical protein PF638_15385 [Candidatus Delongbacteria bacterium]|jgi:hypothetical protein|nr:hypothetical protein [Candidatus Delongbacteria bacterium]